MWVNDDNEGFVLAQCTTSFKAGEASSFLRENGEVVDLPGEDTKDMEAVDPQIKDSKINNLIQLNQLTDYGIVHNLRLRFKENVVYTNVR